MEVKERPTHCVSHESLCNADAQGHFIVINPRRAFAARVTVLGLCVCLSVSVCYLTASDYSCHK